MANEFVARKGLVSSGSINVSGSVTASFFKGDGSQLTGINTSTAISGALSIDTYKFIGDNSTVNYILSQSYTINSLEVYVGGLSLTPVTDYTLSANTLTFVTTPPSESNILIRAFVNVTQNATGSFSGSFFGILASSSYALTASYAANSSTVPDGTVSSSTQIVWASVPYNTGIVSSSAQVKPLLPNGTVSSSAQYPGWVTSSVQVNTGSFSGSFIGNFTGSILSAGLVSSSAQYPGWVTSSTQIVWSQVAYSAGIVSSSAQYPGWVTASSQIDYNLIQNKLSGVVSSSTQIAPLLPNGTVSSSLQYPGWVTSSAQVDVRNTTGISTLATTGSNTFTANQTITGSLFISQNLVVQGSSSISYISQSTLNIGTNVITMNTNTPGTRFGGIEVIDSGSSPQRSGSLFFDSINDQWIFVHQNTAGGITSSVLMMGPPTFNNIGNETLLTQNRVLKSNGLEHISDSQITDNGITVSVTNGLSAGTSITASSFTATATSSLAAIYSSSGQVVSAIAGQTITPTTINTTNITTNGAVTFSALTDTTAANKVLVLNTVTNQLFTTASIGAGGGGSGTGFPYTGSAILSGSLIAGAVEDVTVLDVINPETIFVSASNINAIHADANIDSYVQLNISNNSATAAASSDIVATADNGTETAEFIDMGINSSGYSATSVVGGPNDGYLYITSSVGELHVGNASTGVNSNVRIFAGGSNSDANTRIFVSGSGRVGIGVSSSLGAQLQVQGNISASSFTGSVLAPTMSGSLDNIVSATSAVSGTIPANGTVTVNINLSNGNYFTVSGSAAGTVTWTVSNPAPVSQSETFIIEYINGGTKTNSWFTNTRWPAASAPTLTVGASPDILSFTTVDGGANWRGLLLQRASA